MISRQTIDFIRSLAHKKEREKAGCFVAEGEKLVLDLLKTTLVPMELYATEEGMASAETSRSGINAIRLSGKDYPAFLHDSIFVPLTLEGGKRQNIHLCLLRRRPCRQQYLRLWILFSSVSARIFLFLYRLVHRRLTG